jgi:hypothetical protein
MGKAHRRRPEQSERPIAGSVPLVLRSLVLLCTIHATEDREANALFLRR